jgi:hemolysin III
MQGTSSLEKPPDFRLRDPFCSLSHLIGAGFAVAGLAGLMAGTGGSPLRYAAYAMYGAALILLLVASGVYHAVPADHPWLERLRRLDHAAIYLLIAGTYAPVCLLALSGPWGYAMLAAEAAMAAVGVWLTLRLPRVPGRVRLPLYLGMGWLAIAAFKPLQRTLPAAALAWLLAGGLLYTIGAVVYTADRPSLWPGRFSAHDLWHVFILAAAACHFILIYRYTG